MAYREKLKFAGVYYRVHETRKVNGKPDRCFDINYKVNGKLVWEKVGWLSEGYDAQKASIVRAERVRAVRHSEELPQDKKVTFGSVWQRYADWAKLNTKAFGREENRYKKHLKDKLESMQISKIDPMFLEKLQNELVKSGKAPATVRHILTLVRTVVNKGIKLGVYKGDNPVRSIKLPKLNNSRIRFLTKDEAETLITALSKSSRQWADVATVSLYTGMRAGEIFGLKWKDVDLEMGTIAVLDPKSNENRHVFITGPVQEILARRSPDNAWKQAVAWKQADDYVFKSKTADQIKEVSNTFTRTVDKLGLNDGITDPRQRVTFHSLRHTFASWLALNGEPILTIKELLGHKSIEMTMRYAHLIPDHKRQAVERLAQ